MNVYRQLVAHDAGRLLDMALDCEQTDPAASKNLTELYKRWEAVESAEDLLILIAFVNEARRMYSFSEHVDAQRLLDFVDDALASVARATEPVG